MLLNAVRDVPFVLYPNIYLIHLLKEKTWSAETVIKIPNKKVEGWALPEMPGGSVHRLSWSTQYFHLLCYPWIAVGLHTLQILMSRINLRALFGVLKKKVRSESD